MTKQEFINKWKYQPNLSIHSAMSMVDCSKQMYNDLEEYGKYCAEQAWREAERNMLRSVRVITFESWWSEFQRKEATE